MNDIDPNRELIESERNKCRGRFDRLWDKLKSLVPLYLAYPVAMAYIYEKSSDISSAGYAFPLSIITSMISAMLLLIAAIVILQQSEQERSRHFIGSYYFALSALVGSIAFLFSSYVSLSSAFIKMMLVHF